MKKHVLSLAIAASTIGLTACGGGGDDDNSGSTPPPESYVSGTFYDARTTGDNYPTDTTGLGLNGDHCIGQNHYFEDENQRIRVYGSAGISENTFRLMATYIDNNLDSVMSLFNTNWVSFVASRQLLSLINMDRVLTIYLDETGAVVPALADQYDAWSTRDPEQTYAAWLTMSEAERLQALSDIEAMLDQSEANGARIFESEYLKRQERSFVIACLNSGMSGNTSGEGTHPGMVLTATPSSYDGDFSRLVKHELVHFVQSNMTRVAGTRRSLPRWFEEGQAVVFAGQRYHGPSSHYNYEPLDVVSFRDEVGDPGEAYKHYGLAYNYLDKANGKDGMADMLWAIRQVTVNPMNHSLIDGDYSPRFIMGFDATMVDHNGDPLTFSDYQTNYHDIMNTQY